MMKCTMIPTRFTALTVPRLPPSCYRAYPTYLDLARLLFPASLPELAYDYSITRVSSYHTRQQFSCLWLLRVRLLSSLRFIHHLSLINFFPLTQPLHSFEFLLPLARSTPLSPLSISHHMYIENGGISGELSSDATHPRQPFSLWICST